jgi:integrase
MSYAELITTGGAKLPALPADLADLADQAVEYQRASKSAATVRAYGSDWRDFTAWCSAHGLPSLPASEDAVVGYLTDLARQGRKASTIARRVSAVSQAHQAAHVAPPTRSLAVRATMGGIRRTLGTSPTRKRALMVGDLRSMLATLDGAGRGGELRALRDRAILLLGFAAGMRRSELVGLDVPDIEEAPEGLRVTLRRSKTDQEGEGRTVGVWRGRHAETDPVGAVLAWRNAAALTNGPLFRPVTSPGWCNGQPASPGSTLPPTEATAYGLASPPAPPKRVPMSVTSHARRGIAAWRSCAGTSAPGACFSTTLRAILACSRPLLI